MSIETLMRVRGKNEFGPVVREIQGQIGSLDRTAQSVGASIGGNLGGMIAGGLGALAVGAIVDTGVELTKLGAQAIRVEDGFRNLMQSIGSTSEEALGQLRAASLGTIDDTNLMLSANRAVMLGVVQSSEQLAGLLNAAAERGRNLGVGTAQAFDNIVTGIGRMSPLILDNLGILTGGEKAFDTYAQSIGKTAEQLTDAERKQFLVNKVLADATPLTNDAATAFERLAAQQENFRTNLGKSIAAFADMSGIADGVDRMTRGMGAASEANLLRAAHGIGLFDVAVAQAKAGLGIATTQGELFSNMLGNIVNAVARGTMSEAQAVEQMKELEHQFFTTGTNASVLVRVMDEVAGRSVSMAGSISVASTALMTLGSAAGVASDQLRGVGPSLAVVDTQVAKLRALAESKALSLVPEMGIEGARGVWKTAGDLVDEYAYRVGRAGVTEADAKLQAAATEAAINSLGVAYKSTAGSVNTYNDVLERLRGSVESAIGGAIAGTKSLMDFSSEGMVGSFDPNGPARNFGRMWDVATNGFKSQWLEPLRQEGLIPDDVLGQGEEALKRFAESKARAFQAGTDLGMLDKGAIKAQVMQEIAAQAELARMRDEILRELAGQGISKTAAAGALDTVLGQQGMVPTGQAGAQGYTEGFTASMSGQGSKIVTVLATEIEENKSGFDTVGRSAGTFWGQGFLAVVGDNVPPALITLLVGLVTPAVMARIAADNARKGPLP
jgi:hypothetical protein